MDTYTAVTAAGPSDLSEVAALLVQSKLPVEDIDPELAHFFIWREDESLAGVIGLEIYGTYGLLRSMATDAKFRNMGIASGLVHTLHEYAKHKKLSHLYLLTETASQFFEKKGFDKIERTLVPAEVQQSKEFSHLCPSTATAMHMQIV